MLFRDEYRVESARLGSWDYSWPGWYFVTIVVGHRTCVFGDVIGDSIQLSTLGKTADEFWREIPKHHTGVELDDYFVVMPNHVRGIIILNDITQEDSRRDVQLNVSTDPRRASFRRISPTKRSLSVIVRTYKAAVTTWARRKRLSGFQLAGEVL